MSAKKSATPGVVFGSYPEKKPVQDSWFKSLRKRLHSIFLHFESTDSKQYETLVKQVDAYEPELTHVSEARLKARLRELRTELSMHGQTDALMAELFAIIKKTCARELGVKPYNTQVIAARMMLDGKLAEMATGEGKTLAAAICVAAAALIGITTTMEKLNKSQEEIKKQNADLRNLATRDPLTNCLNRRAFFELADPIFEDFVAQNRPLSCIMSDIDHFKLFNDRYDHAVGDKVLISVSRSLFRGLRIEDLLTRYGGEEFCILLPDATPEIALGIAERLRQEIESQAGSSIRGTQELKVTSSFGLSTLNSNTQNLATLIDQADKALYAAKNGGRNCVKVWGDGE